MKFMQRTTELWRKKKKSPRKHFPINEYKRRSLSFRDGECLSVGKQKKNFFQNRNERCKTTLMWAIKFPQRRRRLDFGTEKSVRYRELFIRKVEVKIYFTEVEILICFTNMLNTIFSCSAEALRKHLALFIESILILLLLCLKSKR